MTALAQAQFEEAIADFTRAAERVPDYGILDRPLIYTPNFMAGWASEKLGDTSGACRFFGRFLKLAPGDQIEPTKKEHARRFIEDNCPAP